MKLVKCFICNKLFKRIQSSHLVSCAIDHDIYYHSKNDLRAKQLEFHLDISYDKFKFLLDDGYTCKDFIKNYDFGTRSYYFLYNYYNLKRTKEETDLLKRLKTEETSLNKYGTKSPNSAITVQNKRKQTLLNKYGVDNSAKITSSKIKMVETKKLKNNGVIASPFKNKTTEEIRIIMSSAWKSTQLKWNERTATERKTYLSYLREARRKWWKGLSKEEKTRIIESRISYKSKLEFKIEELLNQLGIKFSAQKWINKRSYDFYILNSKILIEVQGNYWHGNPEIYKADDFINFPAKQKIKASDLWEKDKHKKENAENYGYKIFYIWESEIKNLSNEKLKDKIQKFILANSSLVNC